MSEATIDFIDHVVATVPTLEPLLREQIADNFGEVLPHVFFGDLTRYVLTDFLATGKANRAANGVSRPVEELLAELELAIAHGGELAELVSVSFLGNLPRPGEADGGVRDLLGPKLRAELDAIE